VNILHERGSFTEASARSGGQTGRIEEMLYHGDSLIEGPSCMVDALFSDPPYSSRTHGGHDAGNAYAKSGVNYKKSIRSDLTYATWTDAHVARACDLWAPMVRGWICILTDHGLARSWESHLKRHGRYVFAPIPCVSPGSRVRLAGDGHSSWTVWLVKAPSGEWIEEHAPYLVTARPRNAEYARWGTLTGEYGRANRGDYYYGTEKMPIVGGKPPSLMSAIISDHSRPGDLIWDPCAGAGTTAISARDTGRRWIIGETDPKTADLALDRVTGAGARDADLPMFASQK